MFHYSLGAQKTADGFKEVFTHFDTFCTCKAPEAASKKKEEKTCLQKFASHGSVMRQSKFRRETGPIPSWELSCRGFPS